MPSECQHYRTQRGKDIPRRYGSYRSEVCMDCKGYRIRDHHNQLLHWSDHRSGWLDPSGYESDTSRDEDD